MSELINTQSLKGDFRHALLANVSILALLGAICAPSGAQAVDKDQPTVWIELGGQLERLDTEQTLLDPPFFNQAIQPIRETLIGAQRPSRYDTGAEGSLTFAPKGMDWIFSASVRYGRVKNQRRLHYQTPDGLVSKPAYRAFGDSQAHSEEAHAILDFQVGKDVGFGLLGRHINSTISAGVRYAQFGARSDDSIHARRIYHQSYIATVHTNRNSHGIGPTASWQASIPIAGHEEDMTLDFDWGINAAVLFGRQKTDTSHATNHGFGTAFGYKYTTLYKHAYDDSRKHSVIMPNVGGFAALSLKFPRAKVSLGYRSDFFFNSADIGLDARDTANQNFYGPFATISIGLGG